MIRETKEDLRLFGNFFFNSNSKMTKEYVGISLILIGIYYLHLQTPSESFEPVTFLEKLIKRPKEPKATKVTRVGSSVIKGSDETKKALVPGPNIEASLNSKSVFPNIIIPETHRPWDSEAKVLNRDLIKSRKFTQA